MMRWYGKKTNAMLVLMTYKGISFKAGLRNKYLFLQSYELICKLVSVQIGSRASPVSQDPKISRTTTELEAFPTRLAKKLCFLQLKKLFISTALIYTKPFVSGRNFRIITHILYAESEQI